VGGATATTLRLTRPARALHCVGLQSTGEKARFALLALALLSLLWWWRAGGAVEDVVELAAPPVTEPRPSSHDGSSRATPPRTAPRAAPGSTSERCTPSAEARCREGDVWLLDSCGRPEEKLDECEAQSCRGDACDPPPSEPCDEPPEGRCDEDAVRLCLAGRPVRIDCRAKDMRCGIGNEGAECKPLIPKELRCSGRARCDGDTLVRCIDGRVERTSCSALRSKCQVLSGAEAPSCVAELPALANERGCGPCGCPADSSARENKCDGRDEDGDGLIDEGLDCGAIPILAYVVTDARGESSHAREDVEAEVAELNRVFADEGDGKLSFVLEQVTFLPDAALLSIDDTEFDQLVRDARLHPQRDELYVPIVFSDELLAGGATPKPGISTLPNATCGSMQHGHGPEVGLVAVAKARYPTTVAHELGHFLGLCHTHDSQEVEPFLAYRDPATNALASCRATCRGQGDGVCDTPYDPGPELCTYDESECRSACLAPASPDLRNLMSYYARCRNSFSAEQRALMQHTVALRRGFQRCQAASCPCQLGADSCPAGMSCRPGSLESGQRVSRCALDGPRAPGADCEFASDCGRGSLCLLDERSQSRRCARACLESASDCQCTAVADDLSICLQDLR